MFFHLSLSDCLLGLCAISMLFFCLSYTADVASSLSYCLLAALFGFSLFSWSEDDFPRVWWCDFVVVFFSFCKFLKKAITTNFPQSFWSWKFWRSCWRDFVAISVCRYCFSSDWGCWGYFGNIGRFLHRIFVQWYLITPQICPMHLMTPQIFHDMVGYWAAVCPFGV